MPYGKNSHSWANNSGAGAYRTAAVTILTDTAIQLLNAHGNTKMIGEHTVHFAVNVADVAIEIHPPFGWGLKPSAQMKWLAGILHDRTILPFGLDIWAPNKVLNVEWNLNEFMITSFRRGPWERVLLLEAKKLPLATHRFIHPGPSPGTVH